jgi:phosphoesterase RecJ-like protein
VLLAHINPDADALGSALALGLALRGRGMQVAGGFAEPATVPDSLAALPGQDLIRPAADLPADPDLVVTLDVGAAERLGALGSMLAGAPSLVIDHHRTNTRFGTHHLIDPEAEATVVLVARLLDVMGATIDADMAACLYAGLATDTVSFRNATAHTHRLAARLVDAGARPAELLAPITDTHPFGFLGMLSGVLHRAVLERGVAAGAPLVHTGVTLADAAGLRGEEVDSVIDIVRTTAGAGVAMVAKQSAPDLWQVSLRSGGAVDVAAVAVRLSGGGHSRAAGFTHHGDYDSATARVREQLQAAATSDPPPSSDPAGPRRNPVEEAERRVSVTAPEPTPTATRPDRPTIRREP